MSYWAHHPEEYSVICNNAIARKLAGLHPETTDDIEIDLRSIVDELEGYSPPLYHAMLSWAHSEIMAGEQDFWGSKIDAAKEARNG